MLDGKTERLAMLQRKEGCGDIVLFSCVSASELRLGADAQRTTLIEPVNDVTGAGQAPVKGGVAAKRNFEAVKRAALRKAPSPAALIPYKP